MDIILGSSALSNFRLEKIKSALQNENISIASITTHYVHLMDLKSKLTDDEIPLGLRRLLTLLITAVWKKFIELSVVLPII